MSHYADIPLFSHTTQAKITLLVISGLLVIIILIFWFATALHFGTKTGELITRTYITTATQYYSQTKFRASMEFGNFSTY